MPRKIRELVAELEGAGWREIPGGKGSPRKFGHPHSKRKVILSGKAGADALYYQEKQVRQAIREIPK